MLLFIFQHLSRFLEFQYACMPLFDQNSGTAEIVVSDMLAYFSVISTALKA